MTNEYLRNSVEALPRGQVLSKNEDEIADKATYFRAILSDVEVKGRMLENGQVDSTRGKNEWIRSRR